MIFAGDPAGLPPDTPADRVDPNTTTSPFAGVGSVAILTRRGAGTCTGTLIATQHVLTAAHCLDENDDGRVSRRDGILAVTFNLNFGSDLSHQIAVTEWNVHPDFTGFNRPSVNDDVLVLKLASPAPAGVPFYSMYTGAMDQPIVMVGYGRSGDGVTGEFESASLTIKRMGDNFPDLFFGQDDYGAAAGNEVFEFDFDGPTGTGPLGGATLGNDRESTVGPGDSGGPSFVQLTAGSYAIAGINTFGVNCGAAAAPLFNSCAGGLIVSAYATWIQAVVNGTQSGSGGRGGSGSFGPRGGVVRPPNMFHIPLTAQHSQPEAEVTGSAGADERATLSESPHGPNAHTGSRSRLGTESSNPDADSDSYGKNRSTHRLESSTAAHDRALDSWRFSELAFDTILLQWPSIVEG
jgi:hypothetical protein